MAAEKAYLLMGHGVERTHVESLDLSPCNQLGCSAYVSYIEIAGGVKIVGKCTNSSEATSDPACLSNCNEISYQAAQALWETKVLTEKRKEYGSG